MPATRKRLLQEDVVRIPLVNENTFSTTDQLAQFVSLASVQVNQMDFAEGRLDRQRVERASGYELSSAFGDMLSRTSKRINIHMPLYRGLCGQNLGIGSGIFADDVQFDLGPAAYFVILELFHLGLLYGSRPYASNTFRMNSRLRRWFSMTLRVMTVLASMASSTVKRRGSLCSAAYLATAA